MRKPNLSTLSLDDLIATRQAIDKALIERRRELELQLARLGAGKPGRRSLKGTKAPIKYRGPNGETWAGRGARPRWLVAMMKKGKKVEDFAV